MTPAWLMAAAAGVALTAAGPRTAGAAAASSPNPGAAAVVVYNLNLPDSKSVADHYAARRAVPPAQVLGLDLPLDETMTRADYVARLEKPLLARLEALRLITFGPATNQSVWGKVGRRVIDASIRYVVLCHGVPARIARDHSLIETNAPAQPELAQRNEAAVDSQLAVAPLAEHGFPWTGPLPSPFFGITNATLLHPVNGLFLVARLDGPSPAIARRLVDQALEAETNGLWGRAYFDARGLATNDSYFLGDAMILAAAQQARQVGFETVLDQAGPTFPPGFPMSQIALYAGWYDQSVSGPFTRPTVEFMPGAFAYHLYSFSASTLRSTSSWAGTLLAKGVTCTLGCVDEPYLNGTPDIGRCLSRLLAGFTFGEAAYASMPSLSWQTTVIGDPLYRPFGRPPEELLADLELRHAFLPEWYYLLAVNRRLASGASQTDAIQALESLRQARRSAILTEKLADLYWARGALNDAADTYEAALRRNPSAVQRQRLLLLAAEKRAITGPDDRALAHYKSFLQENPDHPDRLQVFKAMLPLTRRLQLTNEIARLETEILRLEPSPNRPPINPEPQR